MTQVSVSSMSVRDTTIGMSVLKWQEAFRLRDWDIRYDPDQTGIDDDAIAQLEVEDTRKRATLRIREDIEGIQIERNVVHEMMHLVLRDYWYLANQVIAKTGDAGQGVMDVLSDYLERICETVAEATTGAPWEPHGDQMSKLHAPFLIDHSLTRNEEIPTNA